MTTFNENKKMTLASNLYVLIKKTKVGDKYTDGLVTYIRVNMRKNYGDAWAKE